MRAERICKPFLALFRPGYPFNVFGFGINYQHEYLFMQQDNKLKFQKSSKWNNKKKHILTN